jgi:hypothetical protein
VYGRGIESDFWGQWRCSAWSCVRIFDFLGVTVNGGQCMVVDSNLRLLGVSGGVVHGRGFES